MLSEEAPNLRAIFAKLLLQELELFGPRDSETGFGVCNRGRAGELSCVGKDLQPSLIGFGSSQFVKMEKTSPIFVYRP